MGENKDIDHIIDSIKRLQIVLTETQKQIADLKQLTDRIQGEKENNDQEGQNTHQELFIGDTVEILNSVRLRGNIRSIRNVRGEIVRFTLSYVVVRVKLPVSSFLGRNEFQDIKRAAHNLRKIV